MSKRGSIFFAALLTFTLSSASSLVSASTLSRDAEIAADLEFFATNTREAMQRIPLKRDEAGRIRKSSLFSAEAIASRDFVTYKDTWRSKKTSAKRKTSSFAAPGPDDKPYRVLDNSHLMARTLEAMEASKLITGNVDTQPWSGDYWGFFKGTIANRYADSSFPQSQDWKANFDYVSGAGKTIADIFKTGDLALVNQLSPAEKYDLVIGQPNGLLTNGMWLAGKKYYDRNGHVEDWMGICDGWASASYMLARPRRSIEVMAADGKTKVTFYPHDVKALASLLWAWGNMSVKGYLGSRCHAKQPKMDANGRMLEDECFNTNPGSWHMAVVHQLGFEKKSMAMDATFDYEVWNQPLRGYKYSYFNPRTMAPTAVLADATVTKTDFVEDKFKAYRSPLAVKIVGIAMDLTYIAEDEHPRPLPDDSEINDHLVTVRYYYDLELDVDGTIVGGEWYQNAHPDFLWRPITASHATSNYDSWVMSSWDTTTALPADWKTAAANAAHDRVPLGRIVEQLVQKSSVNVSTLPAALAR
ncbi:MAG: hypothetical protein V4760_11005 [Bdellovibrionota bacterium]